VWLRRLVYEFFHANLTKKCVLQTFLSKLRLGGLIEGELDLFCARMAGSGQDPETTSAHKLIHDDARLLVTR
jgi:hypothetical protein